MEYYKDFYGCTASIRTMRNGTVRLVVCTPDGKNIKTKTYSSRKGARIAMGKMSEAWEKKVK